MTPLKIHLVTLGAVLGQNLYKLWLGFDKDKDKKKFTERIGCYYILINYYRMELLRKEDFAQSTKRD